MHNQIIALFAGSWPSVPHPTLLPGGPGSVCSTYDFDENAKKQTFYYLNLKLPEIQDEDWEEFRYQSDRRGTGLIPQGGVIESREDFFRWQSRFAPVKGWIYLSSLFDLYSDFFNFVLF